MIDNKDDLSSVKIIDFGFSSKLEKDQSFQGIVGTPYFLAPEIIYGSSYKEKVDMWALGIITYCLLAGRYPFNGKKI